MMTKALELIGVLTTFLVLAWLFTLLRMYVRCCITKSWGVDDGLLLATLVCNPNSPSPSPSLLSIRSANALLCSYSSQPTTSAHLLVSHMGLAFATGSLFRRIQSGASCSSGYLSSSMPTRLSFCVAR